MKRTTKLQAYWSEKNTQWESSGIAQKKFCAQHGLVYAQFTYWRGRLQQQKTAPQERKLLKVLMPSAHQHVPVRAEAVSCLEVLLPTGIKLYIKEAADITKAGALIQLLGGA
jgi:hypothetical protein